MLSWSVEVNCVTAIKIGRVPSSLVKPSIAAFIILTVPPACKLVISTSNFDKTAMLFLTVLGISWSFKSRKILCPRFLISLQRSI